MDKLESLKSELRKKYPEISEDQLTKLAELKLLTPRQKQMRNWISDKNASYNTHIYHHT